MFHYDSIREMSSRIWFGYTPEWERCYGEIDEHVRLSPQFWYKKRTDSLSNELATSNFVTPTDSFSNG